MFLAHSLQSLISAPSQPLWGSAVIPGDKSISHRTLMLATQLIGRTTIHHMLESEDVMNTASALRQLGISITQDGKNWLVDGVGIAGLSESSAILDMGNSGTSTRLLMGLITPYPFITSFTGDSSLCKRPMRRVIAPLTQIGARISAHEGDTLPLTLTGTDTPLPITYTLPVPSAQVKSAIMLAALNTPGITTVIEPTPTRDHTERMLRHLGFEVGMETGEHGSIIIQLRGQQELPRQDRKIIIPADPSSAAFPIVAALLVPGSKITLSGICMNPHRTGLYTTLQEMGADITYHNERIICGEPVADITACHSTLKGVEVAASRAPSMIDEYPILAIAAACAKGKSIMHGLKELRVKESDRLAVIVEGLTACGIPAQAREDTLYIEGRSDAPNSGCTVKTHMDHRIAMAFLVLGMASKNPVRIDDGSAISTSFPGFVELMNDLGGSIEMA